MFSSFQFLYFGALASHIHISLYSLIMTNASRIKLNLHVLHDMSEVPDGEATKA